MNFVSGSSSAFDTHALSYGSIGLAAILLGWAFVLFYLKRDDYRPAYAFLAASTAIVILASGFEGARFFRSADLRLQEINSDRRIETEKHNLAAMDHAKFVESVSIERSATAQRAEQMRTELKLVEAELDELLKEIGAARHMALGASTNTSNAAGASSGALRASELSSKALDRANRIRALILALSQMKA